MLVLSRKTGESIFIDDVKVTVVRLDRNRVKIGIDAPRHVQVVREELLREDQRQPELAATECQGAGI